MTEAAPDTPDETTAELTTPAGPPPTAAAVQSAVQWIIDGAPVYDVRLNLEKHFPDENPDRIFMAAAAEIQAAAAMPEDALRGFALMATRNLYQKMNSIGDFAGALAAVKVLINLNRR